MKKIIALMLAVLFVCGAFISGPKPAAAEDGIELESPMLAEQVKAGTLPPVADRLPVAADIMVETDKTPESPKYGGTLRRNNGGQWDFGPFCEEPLFRLTEDGGVTPNVAKGYDVSEDGMTYTIYLREGMKWSDGEPFTADDVLFYYNYMLVTEFLYRKLLQLV